MPVNTSTNGHIEVTTTDFNEFDQGSFKIKISGTDQKTAAYAIIYDSPRDSPIVQIKQNGDIKNSRDVIKLCNRCTEFTIEAQRDKNTHRAKYSQYSFDVVVMSNEQRHPIIDSMTITGRVTEAFVKPLTVVMEKSQNNKYRFAFSPSDNDGPANQIAKYKVISFDDGIELRDANTNNILTVGSSATRIIAVRKHNFNGRIIFTVAAVDKNGTERKSRCVVNKYDSSIGVAPRFNTTGFFQQQNKNNRLAIYEKTNNGNTTTGTIRFILNDSMYDDGNFLLSWRLLKGSTLVKINNSDTIYASDMEITGQNNSPALLYFCPREGKIGTLSLMYELKYMGDVIEGTRTIMELDILPVNDVELIAQNKRIYMMNKHKINLNDVTENGYNGIQTISGTFVWSDPNSESPIDRLNDGSAVANFIAVKTNFNRTLIANITKYDKYYGRSYEFADKTIMLNIAKIRISVAYSNGILPIFKTSQSNIDNILSSLEHDGLNDDQISSQMTYWSTSNDLSDTDVIFDSTGFYGRINITYTSIDTLGNVSNNAVVSLLVCPYSNVRVASIINNDGNMSLQDESILISTIFENSNSENDRYDFLAQEQNQYIRNQMMNLSKADIDFSRTMITTFKFNDVDTDARNMLVFDSIIDRNNINYNSPVSIDEIPWKTTVTYNQLFIPTSCGVYDFNYKVMTNIKSISGNSRYVFAKNEFSGIKIRVINNNVNNFREIHTDSMTCNSLSVIDTSNNPQNLFTIDESGINSTLPVTIEENQNGNSLIVNGVATIETLHSNNSEFINVMVSENIASTSMTVDTIDININLNASNATGSFETLNVIGELTTEYLVVTQDMELHNINVNTVTGNAVTANSLCGTTLDMSGDASILGGLTVDGIAAFNSGIEVLQEIDAENIQVSGTLTVGSATILADTTIDSLVVNYDSEFMAGLYVCDDKVSISEENGFSVELPVTIGSGTSDTILTVNGSTATYGDFSINDTDVLFTNGEFNITVPTNIGSDKINSSLNIYGDLNLSGSLFVNTDQLVVNGNTLLVSVDSVMNGNLDVGANLSVDDNIFSRGMVSCDNVNTSSANINNDCRISGTLTTSDILLQKTTEIDNRKIYPDYTLITYLSGNSDISLPVHYSYGFAPLQEALPLFVNYTNLSLSNVNVTITSQNGIDDDIINVQSGSSVMFLRNGTDIGSGNNLGNFYSQWKEISRVDTQIIG